MAPPAINNEYSVIFIETIENTKMADEIDWTTRYFILASFILFFGFFFLYFIIEQNAMVLISRRIQIVNQEFLIRQDTGVNTIAADMKMFLLISFLTNCKFVFSGIGLKLFCVLKTHGFY